MFSMNASLALRFDSHWQRGAVALLLALLATASISHAADRPLLQGGGVTVTTADAEADMQQAPAKAREQALAQPEILRSRIENIYLRRALALQAERNGLTHNSAVQYKMAAARENVLVDAEMERIAQSALPDKAAIDKLARATYKAEPERFATPALTRARHILIKGNDAEAHKQAEKLLAELKLGADFEELARKNSADPGSAAKGGDLGLFPKGRMVPAFDAALEQLQRPQDLSGIVPSQFGLHIIRLEERVPATSKPYEEVQAQLQAEATAKVLKNAQTREIERLRAQATGDEEQLQAFIAAQKNAAPTPEHK